MDDILASIRRIISDDYPADTREAEAHEAAPVEHDEPASTIGRDGEESYSDPGESLESPPTSDDVSETGSAEAATVENSLPSMPEDGQNPGSTPSQILPEPPSVRPVLQANSTDDAPPFRPTPQESIVSHATTATVGEAFHALSNTILTSNNARTLEDIVKDMLRPMLQAWLDDNLPPLVERLVRAEIERVARGHS